MSEQAKQIIMEKRAVLEGVRNRRMTRGKAPRGIPQQLGLSTIIASDPESVTGRP